MTKVTLAFAVSMAVVAGIAGIGVGYSLTPDYARTMYEKGGMGLGDADRNVDLRYIDAMAAHHRGAMLAAEQAAAKSGRQEIRSLAADILANEPKLIAELYSWKKQWYGDSREVRDPEVPNLGDADAKFDLRFLNAVIAHHEAGIGMTREIRGKSSRSAVLDNADAVEAFLAGSLETLRGWRSDWYGVN